MSDLQQRAMEFPGCPFCGGGNIGCETLDDGFKFVEVCRTCKARGPVYRTMPEAMRGWRDRVESRYRTCLSNLVEALEDLDFAEYHLTGEIDPANKALAAAKELLGETQDSGAES